MKNISLQKGEVHCLRSQSRGSRPPLPTWRKLAWGYPVLCQDGCPGEMTALDHTLLRGREHSGEVITVNKVLSQAILHSLISTLWSLDFKTAATVLEFLITHLLSIRFTILKHFYIHDLLWLSQQPCKTGRAAIRTGNSERRRDSKQVILGQNNLWACGAGNKRGYHHLFIFQIWKLSLKEGVGARQSLLS